MEPRLEQAHDAVESASELADDSTIHEQLNSIRNGIEMLSGDEAPEDDTEEGDRLEQVERQLVELGDEADGLTAEHIETARDQIDAFRRESAQDWE